MVKWSELKLPQKGKKEKKKKSTNSFLFERPGDRSIPCRYHACLAKVITKYNRSPPVAKSTPSQFTLFDPKLTALGIQPAPIEDGWRALPNNIKTKRKREREKEENPQPLINRVSSN